jgi:hypothetical protein
MGGRASVAPQMVLVVQVDNTGLLVIVLVIVGIVYQNYQGLKPLVGTKID